MAQYAWLSMAQYAYFALIIIFPKHNKIVPYISTLCTVIERMCSI